MWKGRDYEYYYFGSEAGSMVLLREVTDDDIELVMAWRSNPLVYQGFYYQKEPLTWEEHYKWWHSQYKQSNWKRWIIQVSDDVTTRDVGCVHFRQLDNRSPKVSIFIGEVTLWGKGISRQALSLALDWLEEQGYEKVHTTILGDNQRSIRLFESLGFKNSGDAREGEWTYELYLKDRRRQDND